MGKCVNVKSSWQKVCVSCVGKVCYKGKKRILKMHALINGGRLIPGVDYAGLNGVVVVVDGVCIIHESDNVRRERHFIFKGKLSCSNKYKQLFRTD